MQEFLVIFLVIFTKGGINATEVHGGLQTRKLGRKETVLKWQIWKIQRYEGFIKYRFSSFSKMPNLDQKALVKWVKSSSDG